MSAVDYAGILNQLKTIIEADTSMAGVRVYVEEDPQFGAMESGKGVIIYLLDRRPTADQVASAGKRTRFIVRVQLWSLGFDLASFHDAEVKRDAVVGALELVLMNNRTIGDKVTSSFLMGGQFLNSRDAQDAVFCALAETILEAEVSAIAP